MTNRPLPEAIRGCWFFIPDASPQNQTGQKNTSIIHFHLDGSFVRFQIKLNARKDIEQGTYTFDGAFLILRGRITDTFRVQTPDHIRWNLEGKKDGQALVRAFVQPDDLSELSPAEQKEIRLLPMRLSINDAQTHPASDESIQNQKGASNGIFQLTYENAHKETLPIASFFVEFHPENHLWIGLTPLLADATFEPELWKRILHDCFLDQYLSKPADVDRVTLNLLDTGHSQTFSYQSP